MTDKGTSIVQDVSMAGVKLTPPITVWAMTLNEWVAVATITYLVLQGVYLLWKWRREWRKAP